MKVLEIIGCSRGFDFYIDVVRSVDVLNVFFTDVDNKEYLINTFNYDEDLDNVNNYVYSFLDNYFEGYSIY